MKSSENFAELIADAKTIAELKALRTLGIFYQCPDGFDWDNAINDRMDYLLRRPEPKLDHQFPAEMVRACEGYLNGEMTYLDIANKVMELMYGNEIFAYLDRNSAPNYDPF